MEWTTCHTYEHKKYVRGQWHVWFAWFPITVSMNADGSEGKVWLKKVLRKGESSYDGWVYEYKLRGK